MSSWTDGWLVSNSDCCGGLERSRQSERDEDRKEMEEFGKLRNLGWEHHV